MAYIVWQCPDATLEERFDAWQESIDTMPDDSLHASMELGEIEGIHEFLRQYMELQKEFLDELKMCICRNMVSGTERYIRMR